MLTFNCRALVKAHPFCDFSLGRCLELCGSILELHWWPSKEKVLKNTWLSRWIFSHSSREGGLWELWMAARAFSEHAGHVNFQLPCFGEGAPFLWLLTWPLLRVVWLHLGATLMAIKRKGAEKHVTLQVNFQPFQFAPVAYSKTKLLVAVQMCAMGPGWQKGRTAMPPASIGCYHGLED